MQTTQRHRVLFLNDVGFQYGAGTAQARQVQSFLAHGCEVGCVAWEPADLDLPALSTRSFDPDLWLGFRHVRYLERAAGMSDEQIIVGLLAEVSRFNPNVIIAGNLHGAQWPLGLMARLQNIGIRTIAYMHDAYLISGRCAYPGGCQLYLTGCNATCPTAEEYPPLPRDQIADHWQLRRTLFNGPKGLEIVANSDWTRNLFKEALPNCHSCETVYLAADETVFKPGDKKNARQRLGLPEGKPIVLCAAVNFQEKRKGTHYLQEIITALKDEVLFAAFGHNSAELEGLVGLGYHTDASVLAGIYQAADLFLGTATEEAFGQTIMEAQLCGLPVVAFQAGGVPEIIRSEITGKLVRTGDTAGVITAVRAILGDSDFLLRSGVWARQSAATRFSMETQANAWIAYLTGQIPRGIGANPPTLLHALAAGNDANESYRPSWPVSGHLVNAEHAKIHDLTAFWPEPRTPSESQKLYELGFHAGDVILEIGSIGGRSATVELRGALANPTRTLSPQYYGVDIQPESIARTRLILADQGLINHCHLFEGNLETFTSRWSIRPTVVIWNDARDHASAAADLVLLSRYLQPGIPVLVGGNVSSQNKAQKDIVRRAAQEWATAGNARFMGRFGGAELYVTKTSPER